MDRERLVDEVLMLMPALMRRLGPNPAQMDELACRGVETHVHVSPGHVQVLIALADGPMPVGRLARGSAPRRRRSTQLVDRLVEHGMVERRHDSSDRRVVLVDYAPGMREVSRRVMEERRLQVGLAISSLSDEEAGGFDQGPEVDGGGFGVAREEEKV